MPPAKKKAGKAQVKVKDMKAKKNPKGGSFSFGKQSPNTLGGTGKTIKIHF